MMMPKGWLRGMSTAKSFDWDSTGIVHLSPRLVELLPSPCPAIQINSHFPEPSIHSKYLKFRFWSSPSSPKRTKGKVMAFHLFVSLVRLSSLDISAEPSISTRRCDCDEILLFMSEMPHSSHFKWKYTFFSCFIISIVWIVIEGGNIWWWLWLWCWCWCRCRSPSRNTANAFADWLNEGISPVKIAFCC